MLARDTPEFARSGIVSCGRSTEADRRATTSGSNMREENHELSAVWAGATENDSHEFRREMEQMWDAIREASGVQFVTEFVKADPI